MIEQFLSNIGLGIQVFFTLPNILAIFVGVIGGIFVGGMPGLTATMAVALLVPLTFKLNPVTGLALLVGVYKGGIYGGSISAILINTPGTPASAATALDGYELAKQGKALKALKMAIYSSVIADISSDLVLILVAAPLAMLALKMGPTELFSLMLFSMTIVGVVSGESLLKGLIAAIMGVLFACVGMDFMTGSTRFAFSSIELAKGIPLVPMLIGLFAIPELMIQIKQKITGDQATVVNISKNPTDNRVSWGEFKQSIRTIFRSAGVGTFIGAIPGIGSVIASFISYGLAKRASKHPEQFGKGSLDGIAAAEAGNNAVCGATLIPLLTLGIPGDTITAVMLGAFLIQGLVPGPNLISKSPSVIYGLFIALMVGNAVNFFIAKIGIKFFARLGQCSKSLIMPIVAVLCVVGSYADQNSLFDLNIMVIFGLLGFVMKMYGYPVAPLIIAFVLSPMMESSFSQALMLAGGDWSVFFTHPVSAAFLLMTTIAIFAMARKTIKLR